MTKSAYTLPIEPKREQARTAQAMYDNPDNIPKERHALAVTLRSHYLSLGETEKATPASSEQNRHLAYFRARRGVWRASLAPILHGIELEYERMITERRQAGLPLTPPPDASVSHIDRISNYYGKYTGHHMRFLRAAGWWAQQATTAFLSRAHNQEPEHWEPLLAGFEYMHHAYILNDAERNVNLAIRRNCIAYVRDLGCAANVTTLNLLALAHPHAKLWADPRKDEDKTAVMLGKVSQLAWTESVNASFFDKTFGDQGEDGLKVARCPFAHDEATIAAGGIWGVSSLKHGPWRVEQSCPANIALTSPREYGYRNISAAMLRLINTTHIAAETLWAP